MEQTASPGTNTVDLRSCIEELVNFTLQSHKNLTLQWDIGLSKEFCSSLLNADSTGVSGNPLYIQLALALYEVITFGSQQWSSKVDKLASFGEGSLLKQKEEWFDLILQKGSELTKILESINFELHVQEPFFTQLKDGLKTIEGRCAVGDYNKITSGALILFNKCLVVEVQDVHRHGSFFEMLEAESLAKVLPGVKDLDAGVQVYRKFYSEEKEMRHGVLAISVAKVAAQPYLSLARILSGLSYEGILSLLGREQHSSSMSYFSTSMQDEDT